MNKKKTVNGTPWENGGQRKQVKKEKGREASKSTAGEQQRTAKSG